MEELRARVSVHLNIAKQHLVSKQMDRNGLKAGEVDIQDIAPARFPSSGSLLNSRSSFSS